MKRIFALLLVVCMVFTLVACGKQEEPAPTDPTTPPATNPYAGKTLYIWGLREDDFQDYSQFDKDNYNWMIYAAIEEWAAMNDVTIRYRGSYNTASYLAALSSTTNKDEIGDIIFETDHFSSDVHKHVFAPFTEEECTQLSSIVGDSRYMDMLRLKEDQNVSAVSYGVVLPWAGNMMVYFNQSMFTQYNVKSPLEYYNEGTWTWENFEKCMTEITQDLNNDGTNDIYGLSGASWEHLVNPEKQNSLGLPESNVTEPWFQDLVKMKHRAYNVTHSSTNNSVTAAMEIANCLTYSSTQLFQINADGDKLVAVPLPTWEDTAATSNKQWLKWAQSCAHLAVSVTEREAAFDLLCYVMQCGMKYMFDSSFGMILCDHPGIKGSSEASKAWNNALSAALNENKATLQQSGQFVSTVEYIHDISQQLPSAVEWYTYIPYLDIPNPMTYPEIVELLPEVSIPAIKEKHQKSLGILNDLR